jgi:hypothetical protein
LGRVPAVPAHGSHEIVDEPIAKGNYGVTVPRSVVARQGKAHLAVGARHSP